MDFCATIGLVVRRWYVVFPALLLSFVGVAAVYVTSPTTYETTAVLLLHPPASGAVVYANGFRPDAVNPLLNTGNDLNVTTTVLIQSMHTQEFADAIGLPTDGRTSITVNNGSENPELLLQGPFVFITVDSPAVDLAQAVIERAVAAAHADLVRRQATVGAPRVTYVELTEIVPPSAPVGQHGSKLRAAGAALVLGLILSLAAGFAAESCLSRRDARSPIDDAMGEEIGSGRPEKRPFTHGAEPAGPRSPTLAGHRG